MVFPDTHPGGEGGDHVLPLDNGGLTVDSSDDARLWAERAVEAVEDTKTAVSALAELGTTVLRLLHALEPLKELNLPEAQSAIGKVAYAAETLPKTLQKAGLQIVDLAGLPYSAGLDVEVLNLSDFAPDDDLVVDVVVEPLVTYTPRLTAFNDETHAMTVRPGRVTVKKAGSH